MAAKKEPRSSRQPDDSPEGLRILFGSNLRRARLRAKLTQADVEARAGIRQHYISEVENGIHNVTIDTMTALARAIDSDVRTLLKRLPKGR
jgi:transcriptional regulator with XRE-family HTH domain